MMNRTWSFFDQRTLLLTGGSYSAPDDTHLGANTPVGCASIEGAFDRMTKCVRLVVDDFGNTVPIVIDWRPPRPDDDELRTWLWDDETRCYVARPTFEARRRERIAEVQAEIEAEERQQLRQMREALLSKNDAQRDAALQRLEQSDARIAEMRAQRADIEREPT